MSFLRFSEARAASLVERQYMAKSASQLLNEAVRGFSPNVQYDVFLSHSSKDADIILGVKKIIESSGLKVYVDWIEDSALERSKVTSATAEMLRVRMRASSSLVYVHTANATQSVWMPWELGYFDGFKPAHVWILPLVSEHDSEFKGQEYLGLYPPVENLGAIGGQRSLGFAKVGQSRMDYPLMKAVRDSGGISYVTR